MGIGSKGGKEQKDGTFVNGFLGGMMGMMGGGMGGDMGGMAGTIMQGANLGKQMAGGSGTSTGNNWMSMMQGLQQQQDIRGILESFNQNYNRPTADTQGPVAPIGGVSLKNKMTSRMRSGEE